MLRFAEPYDKTFNFILDYTLVVEANMVIERDLEDYKEDYPLSSRYFNQEEARNVLLQLQKANKNTKALYFLTDYHFALIYEALDNIGYIIYYNKELEFDLEEIVGSYFWDEDFLWSKDEIMNCPMKVKEQMGVSNETFGVITGLKPHPKEIELRIEKRGNFKPKGYNKKLLKEIK